MLSTGDTAALLALLSEDRSMENHVSAFTVTFKRHQHFTACCCLLLLLEDWRILKQTQRLAALYILFDLYRVEQPSTNPFMSSLVDAASDETASKLERGFLLTLFQSLNNNNIIKELSKKTATEFISTFDSSAHTFVSGDVLRRQYSDKLPPEPHISSFKKASINNALPDPDIPQGYDPDTPELGVPGGPPRICAGNRDAAATGLVQASSLDGLEPPWVRLAPPRFFPQEGELIWLIPDTQHELLWDYSMCADTSRGTAVWELIARSLKGALTPAQQQELVENNVVIVVEILLKLMNSNQINDYFKVLVKMDMGLHSMEVVNRLTTAIDLPTEFVHTYISNCISSCQNIKGFFGMDLGVPGEGELCIDGGMWQLRAIGAYDHTVQLWDFCTSRSVLQFEHGKPLEDVQGFDTIAKIQQQL